MSRIKPLIAAGALALSGLCSQSVYALGLGKITLKSALNEPFAADIRLVNVGGLSENEILPNLASQEDFARAGVERVFFLTNIKFDVEFMNDNEAVIHLTTDSIVREPFLNFLVELHWPSGRLLREYTVLLDPPVFAEQAAAPVSAPVTEPATEQKKNSSVSTTPTRATVTRTTATTTKPSGPRTTTSTSSADQVTVQRNDTLWGIARDNRPADDLSINDTMMAIQQKNPQAFIRDNINLLKAGAVLRMPTRDEVLRAAGSSGGEIARQNDEWQQDEVIDARQSELVNPVDAGQPDSDEGRLTLVSDDTDDLGGTDDISAAGASVEQGNDLDTKSQGLTDVNGEGLDLGSAETNPEMQGQIQDMQDEIEQLKRLVELKDQQLALLQASEPAPASAAEVAQTQASVDQSQSAGSATTKSENGWMTVIKDNLMYVLVVVFVVLLGGLILGASRRKQKFDEEMSASMVVSNVDMDQLSIGEEQSSVTEDSADNEVVADTASSETQAENTEEKIRKVLEEADIYIAYGRQERAEEMLLSALEENAEALPVRMKLVELYGAAGKQAQLDQQVAILRNTGDTFILNELERVLASQNKPIEEEVAIEPADTSLGESDFEFDRNSSETAAEVDSDSSDEAVDSDVSEELTDLEFETDFSRDETYAGSESEDQTLVKDTEESSTGSVHTRFDSDQDADMDFLGDTDAVATKLELAYAYIEMEDSEAAREILAEVMSEGNDSQKVEAKKLLDTI